MFFFAKLWPLRAKREERGGRAARLLTPAGLALPGYNWGRSQLAFRQREYLAPRAREVYFCQGEAEHFTRRSPSHIRWHWTASAHSVSERERESCFNLFSGIKIKSLHICRRIKQAVPETIKWPLFFFPSYRAINSEWLRPTEGFPFVWIWD